jgi:hypothetical protein
MLAAARVPYDIYITLGTTSSLDYLPMFSFT